jgi:hypothetical protein
VDLLPGVNWQVEIPKAIRLCDIFLVCFSTVSSTKSGYVQREFRQALSVYAQKAAGTIFFIPGQARRHFGAQLALMIVELTTCGQ